MIFNWFKKSPKIEVKPKGDAALLEAFESLGDIINVLRSELKQSKDVLQVLIGAILLQQGSPLVIDNKFVDDMTKDLNMFVTFSKDENNTTLKLEKLSD